MTRTVADAAFMLNVMAGQHREDPASVPGKLDLPLHPDGIKGWRIALSMDLGYIVQSIDFPRVCPRAGSPLFQEVGGSRKLAPRT